MILRAQNNLVQNPFQQFIVKKMKTETFLYDHETLGPYWQLWWHCSLFCWRIRGTNRKVISSSMSTKTQHTLAINLRNTINVFLETRHVKRYQAISMSSYADEAENLSHKEFFSIFATYYSLDEKKFKTSFLNISNLNADHRRNKS